MNGGGGGGACAEDQNPGGSGGLGRSPSRQPISCSLEKIVTFDVCIVEFWFSEPRLVARALAEPGGGGGGGGGGGRAPRMPPLHPRLSGRLSVTCASDSSLTKRLSVPQQPCPAQL